MATKNIDFNKLTKKSYTYDLKKIDTINLSNFADFDGVGTTISASGSTLTVKVSGKTLKFTNISNPNNINFTGSYENSLQAFYNAKFATSWLPTSKKTTKVTGTVFDENIDIQAYDLTTKGLTVNGGKGNDTITGTSNNDTLVGGLGQNTIVVNPNLYDDTDFGKDTITLTAKEGLTVDLSAFGDTFTSADSFKGKFSISKNDLVLNTGKGNLVFKNFAKSNVTGNTETAYVKIKMANGQYVNLNTDEIFENGYTVSSNAKKKTATLTGNRFSETISLDAETLNGYTKTINAGNGTNNITVNSTGKVTVNGGSGVDNITVNVGDNATVNSGAGVDTIVTNNGNDTINAGDGADFITANKGNDKLTGGKGADTFIFNKNDGVDTITDATAEDIIQINGVASNALRYSRNGNNLEIFYSDEFDINNKIIVQNHFTKKGRVATTLQVGGENINLSTVECVISGSGKINGNANDNIIIGSAKADTIKAGAGSDVVLGFDGADTIYGEAGSDEITGGKGNDKLYGGAGENVFYFNEGDGVDTVYSNGGEDTVQLNKFANIDALKAGVTLSSDGTSLKIKYSESDTVVIDKYYTNKTNSVQHIADQNGNTISVQELIDSCAPITVTGSGKITGTKDNDSITGGSKADTINALAGNDTINAAGGNDTMTGGTGTNTYVFEGTNFGKDTINLTATEKAVIDFSAYNGLTEENISYSFSGNNLVIKPSNYGQVTITNFKKSDITGEGGSVTLKLAGGDVDLKEKLYSVKTTASYTGSWLDEEIDATNATKAITINAGKGSDTIKAGKGADTFVFVKGDGADTLENSNSKDKIQINTIINVDDITFAKAGNNLSISYGEGDNILVKDYFTTENRLNTVQVLRSKGKYNTINIADNLMVDVEVNADYNKTSNYKENLIIANNAGNINVTGLTARDRITFAEGNELNYSLSQNGLSVAGTSTTVTLTDHATADLTGVNIFVNGVADDVSDKSLTVSGFTTFDGSTLPFATYSITGTNGADTLTGGIYADTLTGGLGNDTLTGGNGADTFVFAAGDGKDVITDATNIDTIKLTGRSNFEGLTFARGTQNGQTATSLYITSGDDSIEVKNYFTLSGNNYVMAETAPTTFVLQNGNDSASYTLEWRESPAFGTYQMYNIPAENVLTGVAGIANWVEGTENADNIVGVGRDDILKGNAGADSITAGAYGSEIYGGAGDDTLTGGAGIDFIDGGAGADTISGGEGNDFLAGGDGNDSISGGAGNDFIAGEDGNDILTGGAGNDQFHFNLGDGKDTVTDAAEGDMIVFTDNQNLSSITFERGNGNSTSLFITYDNGVGNDVIEVKDYFVYNGENYVMKEGAINTYVINNRARTLEWMQDPQTGEWGMYAATTVINGTDGDDDFTSTDENEIFNLKKGNDTVTFGAEFGDDEINANAKDWVINQEGSMNKDILKFTNHSVADGTLDFDVTHDGNLIINSTGGTVTINNFASPETPSAFIYDKYTDTTDENSTKRTSYEARGFYASSYKIDPHAYNNNAYDHANKSIGTDTYPYGLNTIFVMKGEDAEINGNKGKINVYSDLSALESEHVFATLGGIDMDYWHQTDAADDTCITYDGDDSYEVFHITNDTKLRIKDTGGTDTIVVRDDRLEWLKPLFNVNADGTYDNVNMKIVRDDMITSENFKSVYNSDTLGIRVTASADGEGQGEGIEKILAAGYSVNNVKEWKDAIAGGVSTWLNQNGFSDVEDALSRGTSAQIAQLYDKFSADYTANLESKVISNIQCYQDFVWGSYTGYGTRAFGTDSADTIELVNARGDDYRVYTKKGDDTVKLAGQRFNYFNQLYFGQTVGAFFKPGDGNDTIINSDALANGAVVVGDYTNGDQIKYAQTTFEGVLTSGHTDLYFKDIDIENISAVRDGDDIVLTYQTKNGNEVATSDTVRITNGYYSTNVNDIIAYTSTNTDPNVEPKKNGYYTEEHGEMVWHDITGEYNEFAQGKIYQGQGSYEDVYIYQQTGAKKLREILTLAPVTNTTGEAQTLKGWIWNDDITAGDNGDTIIGYSGNDTITGGAGNDTIYGGNGVLQLTYSDGSETYPNVVETSKFNLDRDTIRGGAGNDYIDAGGGTDIVYGDEGDDTIYGSHDSEGYWLAGGESEEIGLSVRTRLYGGVGNDTINGAGYIFADDVELDAQGNIVYNEDGTTNHVGAAGNDRVYGGGEIHTGDGNDTITTYGGAGYVRYDSIGQMLSTGKIAGFVDAGAGDDLINLGEGYDSCADTTVLAGDGNDEFRSEYRYSKDLSNNKLYGQAGNDHFYLAETNKGNYIDGGEGDDTIEINCQLAPNDSSDPDWEKPYSNTVKGGAGDDILVIMNAQNSHNMEYLTFVGTNDVVVKKIAPLAFFDLTYNSQTHEWETGEDVYINSAYRYDYDIWDDTFSTLAFGKKDEAITIEGALTDADKTETILIKNTTQRAKDSGAVNYTDKNGYRQLDLDALKAKYITYLQNNGLTSLETALSNETHKAALAELAISDDVWKWTLKRPDFESDVEVIEGDGTDKVLKPDNYRTFGYSGGGVRYTEYYKGSDGNETINAVGGGTDYIEAGGGNDTIYAGYGDDTIYGGTGNNTIVFEKGTEYNYYQNQVLQTKYITAGHDVVYSTAGGHDTLVFDNTSLVDFGRNGRDLIIYHDFENQMYGVKDGEIVFNPDNARYSSVTVKDYFANTTDNTVTAGHSVEYIQVAGQEKEAPVNAYSRIGDRILNTDRDLYNNDNVSAMTVYGIGNNDYFEFSLTKGVTRTAFAGEGDDTMYVGAGTVYAYGGEGDDTFTHSNFTPPDASSNLKFAYLDGGEGSDRYDFFEDPFEVLTVVSDSGSDHTGDILQFTHAVYGLKNGVYSTYDVTYNHDTNDFEYGDLYLAGSTNAFSKTAGIKIVDGSVGTIQTATAENDIVYFTMNSNQMEGLKSATANWLSSNYAALDAAGFVTDGKVNSMDIVNNLGSNIDLQNSWQNTLGGNNFWTQHPGV